MTPKFILLWYAFLSTLAVLSPSNIQFFEVLPGLVFMWILFGLFSVGYRRYEASKEWRPESHVVFARSPFTMLVYGIASFAAAIVLSYFYTGQSPLYVFESVISGNSLYREYQIYFDESGLAELSLSKMPYVLLGVFLKINLIISSVCFIGYQREIDLRSAAGFILVVFASLYFSLARGTSFELFELLLVVIFSLYIRSFDRDGRWGIDLRMRLMFAGMVMLSLLWYGYNVDNRGAAQVCTLSGICIDSSSFLHSVSQPVGDLLFKLSSYFSFGIYFTSELLVDTISTDIKRAIAFTFPFGPIVFGYEDTIGYMCSRVVNCGVSWVPDSVRIVSYFGFILLGVLYYYIGVLTKNIEKRFSKIRLTEVLLLFFVVFSLVSMPIGKFISTSSSNWISFVGIAILLTNTRLARVFEIVMGVKSGRRRVRGSIDAGTGKVRSLDLGQGRNDHKRSRRRAG